MSDPSSVPPEEIQIPEDQVLISRADLGGRITYVNAEMIAVSGYSEAELLGQPHKLMRHPDMPEQVFADLWRDIRAGRPWIGILQNRCKNGSSYWVEAHVSPLREGRVTVGYISVRRRASEWQIERARTLYAAMRGDEGSRPAFLHGQRAEHGVGHHVLRRFAALSLTWKFILSALFAITLLLTVFGSVLVSQVYSLLDQNERQRLAHEVALLRTAFEATYQHELNALEVAAKTVLRTVQAKAPGKFETPQHFESLARQMVRGGGEYGGLDGELDGELGARASVWLMTDGVLMPARGDVPAPLAVPIRHAFDHSLMATVSRGERVSSVQFSGGRYYLLYFQPLVDAQARVKAVLVLSADLSANFAFLIERFRQMDLGEGGYYYLLDAHPGPQFGRLIMHRYKEGQTLVQLPGPDGSNALQEMRRNVRGLLSYRWMNEEVGETEAREKLVAYETLPGLDWIIVGGAAVRQFSVLSNSVASTLIGGVVTMVIVMFLIIFALIRRLVLRPIRQQILPCFQAIAEGDYTTRLDVRGQDEMAALIQGLESLQNRRAFEGYQAEAFARMREQAQHEAEALSRSRTDFLANMSHEIRTPMNAVIGLTYLLKRSELPARERDYVHRIESSSQLLLSIINDILDFSKIDANRMLLEQRRFALDDVLDNLSEMMRPRAQEKQLLFEYVVAPDVPAVLCGDPLRLTQILINLVGNAIKFTARGSVIVFVTLRRREDDRLALEFKVQDTGIGMSAEQIARLFTPFSQADSSTTRRFGGTGLGLVICQRLIALMGGKIWVDSEPGIGSTFSFDVWLDAVSADHSEAKARGRVLVVDDHELSRTVLSAVLKNQGYDVIAADSGEAALALLLNAPQAPVDYVLTDFLMPGMDGLALARHLRDALRYPLKIVLVTTLDTASAADPAVLASFDAILEKPVTAQKVGETLSRLKRGAVLPAIAAPAAQTSLAGMSILVAEDVPTNQLIIRDLLESLGATVYIADHGEAAVQGVQALAKQLDLVLMDIQMPVMDGLAATRQIRAGGVRADIPIIALTANVFSEERERAMAAGMTDFLVKPIEPERLVDVLQRWRPTRPPTEASEPAPVPLAVNAAPADFPALAGIDTVDGLRRMMNRRGLYEKVLQDFYLRFDGETGRIIDALQSGEREMAIRRAHSLKGTGGTIGAQRLAECARQLEASLREATQDAPPQAALDALGMALDEVLASIAAAFPGMRPSSS